jgi:hypothetical protein
MEFGLELIGERRAGLRFEEFPERARQALVEHMNSITQRLLARVQGEEPELTGKLRSETTARVSSGENYVRGSVGVRVPGGESSGAEAGKAAALEYGAHKTVAVKAYSKSLDHVFTHAMAPTTVMVSAYQRRANIAERKFLRGPLDEMHDAIIAELRAALEEAAAG